MSDIPVNPIEPTPGGGEGVAERYVDKELVESKASLRRTQIISVVLSVFVIAYMTYLTNGFRENMEPKAAATIVTGMASQRLDDVEPQVSDYIHQQVPEMIRKVPDQVIEQLPEYRKNIESRFETTLRDQVKQGSDRLNKQLDEFLTAHKDEVGQLLKNGQDPAAMAKFGDELEASFKDFLDKTPIGGDETIQQKLDAALTALKQVSDRTAKLAANKGLTDSEKSARHAVAMLMRQVQANAPEGGADAVREHVSGLVNDAASTIKENLPTGGMSMGGGTPEEAPATGTTPRATPPPTKTPTAGKPGMPGVAPVPQGAPKPGAAAKPAPAKA